MTAELLPCPFCGEIPSDIADYSGHYGSNAAWYVSCRNCDISRFGKKGEGEAGARTAWNHRSPLSSSPSPEVTEAMLEAGANTLIRVTNMSWTEKLCELMAREIYLAMERVRMEGGR